MEYFLGAYKKYAEFDGRARRKEYWLFYLLYIVSAMILAFIDGIIGTGGLLAGLYILGSIVPFIALTARRLHDIDKSGWWQLIVFVPVIGPIVMLVFAVIAGTSGENRFGADPIELEGV